MKIGEAIMRMEFSDDEKERIGAALLQENSLPFKILHDQFKNIPENDFWNRAHRALKVEGFRVGSPAGQNQVLQRAKINLRKTGGANCDEVIWSLYRRCATNYVINELDKLNQVLLQEDLTENSGTLTEQIFKSIKPKMFVYGATFEEAAQFYELWPFERVTSFEKLWGDGGVDGELVRKLIVTENEKLRNELTSELNGTKAEIRTLAEQQKKLSNTAFSKIEQIQSACNTALDKIKGEINSSNLSLIQRKMEEMGEKIKKAGAGITLQREPKNNVDSGEYAKLNSRIDYLATKIQEYGDELEKLREIESNDNKSDVTEELIDPKKIISDWTNQWKELGVGNVHSGQLWLMWQLLRRSKVIISAKPVLFVNLLRAVPNSTVKTITASPLWVDTADWKTSCEWVMEETSETRVLQICDFDVAIQEAYLVPQLISFIQAAGNPNARIVLIPSRSDLTNVSPRVLEFATFFNPDDIWFSDLSRICKPLEQKVNLLTDKISITKFLGYTETTGLDYERDLKKLAANRDVDLPPRLSAHFVNIYSALPSDLLSGDGWKISSKIALLEWVQRTKGENFKRVLEESLKASLGAG